LAWSKKSGFEPTPIYREDLEKLVKEVTEFYKEKTPLIKKHLE